MKQKNRMKKVLSGMLALVFMLQPMNFQAQENLTEKVSDINILIQEPMNELFGQDGTDDVEATIEDLEYRYSFKKKNFMNAAVGVFIEMTVLGVDYEIEAFGDVGGEKLPSGQILWMGPLEGAIVVDDVDYLVMLGFTKLNEAVQISVTIQSKDDDKAIGPVMFSFGDCVITKDIYQEIIENQEVIQNQEIIEGQEKGASEFLSAKSSTASTFAINKQPIYVDEPGTTAAFQLKIVKHAAFANSGITGDGQVLYGYYDEGGNRLAISLQSCCSNLENYYNSIGHATSEIESITYRLKRVNEAKINIIQTESFDYDVKKLEAYSLIMDFFSDAFTVLGWNIPTSVITDVLSGVYGYITREIYGNIGTVEVKMGIMDHADFDRFGTGLPVIFILSGSGTQDFTLETAISYRTIVQVNGTTDYTVYYNSAKEASCGVKITKN